MLAMLRSCGEAASSSDCDTAGYCCTTSGCSPTSLMRSRAPMRRPSAGLLDAFKGQHVDVDQLAVVFHVQLHQVEQRGAAGNEGRARVVAHGSRGFFGCAAWG